MAYPDPRLICAMRPRDVRFTRAARLPLTHAGTANLSWQYPGLLEYMLASEVWSLTARWKVVVCRLVRINARWHAICIIVNNRVHVWKRRFSLLCRMWIPWKREGRRAMGSENTEMWKFVPFQASLTGGSNGTTTSTPQSFQPAGEMKSSREPILEAVYLKKDFPLRTLKLFGPARAVHAVEDTSLALYPGKATALVGE